MRGFERLHDRAKERLHIHNFVTVPRLSEPKDARRSERASPNQFTLDHAAVLKTCITVDLGTELNGVGGREPQGATP